MTDPIQLPDRLVFPSEADVQTFVAGLVDYVISQHEPETRQEIEAAIQRKEGFFKSSDLLPDGTQRRALCIPAVDSSRFPDVIEFDTIIGDAIAGLPPEPPDSNLGYL